MHRVPVGHENALETPLPLQYFEVEEIVLRGVNTVNEIVGVHYCVDVGLGDGSLESGQIDFAQGALIRIGACVVPIDLLIVECVVADGSDNTQRLQALDVGDG